MDDVFAQEFGAAEARGKAGPGRGGWRYAHCMAACRIRKECRVPKGVIWGAGVANEALQVIKCKSINPKDCASAWSDTDFDDNKTGFTCPTHVPCGERCSAQKDEDKEEWQYGPFWKKGKGK